MFGGGALTEVFTLKLFEGRTTESLDPNKLFPKLKDPVGGGGGGGLGPPSKKSSIVGKVGGSPPGPKRFELLLLLSLLLFLLKYEGFPLSLSSLFQISNSLPCWLGKDLIKSLSDCFLLTSISLNKLPTIGFSASNVEISLKQTLRDSVSSKYSC